jgi:hypothetical protein
VLTDPVSLGLAALAAALAAGVTWVQLPRTPHLEGERWFKLTLATLLRGKVEQQRGEAADWEREVRELVPYHPAGRWPERKISNPVAHALPSAALPGEHALLEALAARSEPAARWAWLYDEDPAGLDARYSDPAELGPEYDWSELGQGASWDTLAAWGTGDTTFRTALLRAVPARYVLFEGRPDKRAGPSVLDAMVSELEAAGQPAVRVPWGQTAQASEQVRGVCPQLSDRAVLVAEEAAVIELLRVLQQDAELRDRVSAVVSVGGVIGGRTDEPGPYGEATCQDWLGAHFTQNELDTELVRLTPYMAVQWLDRRAWPPGVPGLPLAHSRFPEPRSDVPIDTIESVDLGPLPADRPVPVELVARALLAVVGGWVHSRR